ncbi:desert hedgehog protein B [Trichonephila clavata]|uniref:Hedgehog protein n=1 Tax=Trichonephila clavata TaxID=2740835 RepID=A0A8X6IZC8_TRICU|nr:desert hedgehog protein B [Trichonephila clavata]
MVQKKTRRICNRPFNILQKHLFLLLCFALFSAGVYACSPGRSGARRRSIRKLTPLVFKQHVPNVPENSLGASGPSEKRIQRGDARFKELILNYNADIVYKDKKGTGADRVMTQRCKEKLNNLAISVMNQWPSVRLRVTEGFDEDGYHAPGSLHYSGRAVDITTSDRDTKSTMPNKNIGCFQATSTVMTRDGYKKMVDLKIGDEVVSKFEVNGILSFSKVIAFLHRDEHMNVTFVRLQTNNSNILLLTQRHLLFKWENKILTATYAVHIKEGDFIYTRSVANQTMLAAVTNVSLSTQKGVYAPLTESGTIVVDGIWASCYAEVASHNLAHALFFPVRFLHVIKTFAISVCRVVLKILDFLNCDTWSLPVDIAKPSEERIVEERIHWYPRLLCWIIRPYFVIFE